MATKMIPYKSCKTPLRYPGGKVRQYIHWKNPDSNQLFIKENFQNETDTLKFTLCSPNGEIIDFVREDKIIKYNKNQ